MVAEKVGGNPRFSGSGQIWKTGWKNRPPFTEICCFEGFSPALGDQYYTDPTSSLAGDTAAGGLLVGVVVGLQEIPAGFEPVVNNFDNGVGGWELTVGPSPTTGAARFVFTVYNAVGQIAQVNSQDVFLTSVDPLTGNPAYTFVPVIVGFTDAASNPPNGSAFIITNLSGAFVVGAPLSDPYADSGGAALDVGIENLDSLSTPNCIHGIVGGTAGTLALGGAEPAQTFDAWEAAIRSANEIVAIPDPASVGLTNTNGWRAPSQHGPAPNPLTPFIGATNLVYALDPSFDLDVGCTSPGVWYPDNLFFPFTNTAAP